MTTPFEFNSFLKFVPFGGLVIRDWISLVADIEAHVYETSIGYESTFTNNDYYHGKVDRYLGT